MTSHDPERSSRDPNTLKAHYRGFDDYALYKCTFLLTFLLLPIKHLENSWRLATIANY